MPKPPEKENKDLTWPHWPNKLRTSSSQDEGCHRDWSVVTKSFKGENSCCHQIQCARVEWTQTDGRWEMAEIAGSGFTLKADLVLLAMGFVHPVHEGMLKDLGVNLDGQGNVDANTDDYNTSIDKVFAAGDMRRGQSLVVWAIREGPPSGALGGSIFDGEFGFAVIVTVVGANCRGIQLQKTGIDLFYANERTHIQFCSSLKQLVCTQDFAKRIES